MSFVSKSGFTSRESALEWVDANTSIQIDSLVFWTDGDEENVLGAIYATKSTIAGSPDLNECVIRDKKLGEVSFNETKDLVFKDTDGEILCTLGGIKAALDLDNVDNTLDVDKPLSTAMLDALGDKQDVEAGKGLSSNDLTDELLDQINTCLQDYVPKDGDKELSDNNFSDAYKDRVDSYETPLAKGYYTNVADLTTSITSPLDGMYAYVKSGVDGSGNNIYDLYKYSSSSSSWVDKGPVSGAVTLEEIKTLISNGIDVNLVTDAQLQDIDNLPATYVAKDGDKSLSDNNFTDLLKDKLLALPDADINTASGLVKLLATGVVDKALLPPDLVYLNSEGLISDDLLSGSSTLSSDTLDTINTFVEASRWKESRAIQKISSDVIVKKTGSAAKDSTPLDDNISLYVHNEGVEIYYSDANFYPGTVTMKWSGKGVKKDKGKTLNWGKSTRDVYSGNSVNQAFFPIDWRDDWDTAHGDIMTLNLTLKNPDTGDKWIKTYDIVITDLGGKRMSINFVIDGDSLTDPTKVPDGTNWK